MTTTAATPLAWSPELELQHAQMDDTHREFVTLLQTLATQAEAATAAPELLPHLQRFIEHTEAHFGQEDRWMQQIGFGPENCHARQHAMVLQLLHEVHKRVAEEGQLHLVSQLVPALAEWFVPHAQQMDGGLAQVMALTGYDPITGTMTNPPQAQEALGDEVFQGA